MWTIPSIPGLIGLVLLMLMVASAEKNHPETDLRVGFKDTEMVLEVNYILIYKYEFKIFFHISQDFQSNVDDRSMPNNKLNISRNHLIKVVEKFSKEWKLDFQITIYKMPAYDRQWINILHVTLNGNKDMDNIFKLCIFRNGLVGNFAFQYWGQRKEMHFALGTSYHIVVEQYERRKGSRYGFLITVDGEDVVDKNLKNIQKGLRAQTYRQVKIYASNPWQSTLPTNVGEVKNLKIQAGEQQNCCKIVTVRIDKLYLSASYAGEQKSLIGEYKYKGTKNFREYWIKTDGQQAIWFNVNFKEWSIGNILSLGTNFRGLAAEHTSAKCPTHNTNRWHYFDGYRWKSDLKSQIHVNCKENPSDFYNEQGTYAYYYLVI